MTLSRYVEIGRIVIVNRGPEYGKVLCIVDIVDCSRVVVDSPNETRRQISLKVLSLTGIKIDIPRAVRKRLLDKEFLNKEVFVKFGSTSWGVKIESRIKKLISNDFDRFKSNASKIKRQRE